MVGEQPVPVGVREAPWSRLGLPTPGGAAPSGGSTHTNMEHNVAFGAQPERTEGVSWCVQGQPVKILSDLKGNNCSHIVAATGVPPTETDLLPVGVAGEAASACRMQSMWSWAEL